MVLLLGLLVVVPVDGTGCAVEHECDGDQVDEYDGEQHECDVELAVVVQQDVAVQSGHGSGADDVDEDQNGFQPDRSTLVLHF